MYTYMEYLQKCFYKSTSWNEDNIFSNITASSSAILEFPIPTGIKLDSSSKSSEYSASSFTLSNYHSINGSLAYLYSSVPLRNTMGTREISLQDAIAGFRIIEPNINGISSIGGQDNFKHITGKYDKSSLLYGRMYFPGSALEAMIIKRITSQTQLLIKCINNPHLDKNGTMILYLQKNTPKYSREFIYSTNESLIGFRCLYNFGNADNANNINTALIPKFDNSVISIGTELWYAARTMSPGLSTAFRYSTRSTSTGKPLTMTLAVNPILGHISSTYTVKTSVASTFSSKYDFNFFSYASNLSLGFELYNYSKENPLHSFTNRSVNLSSEENKYLEKRSERGNTIPIRSHTSIAHKDKDNLIINPIQNLDNYYHINPTLLPDKTLSKPTSRKSSKSSSLSAKEAAELERLSSANSESVTTAFQNLVNESDFASVVKFSTSLNDRMVKILWEGRVKDFLVSTGVKVSVNPTTNAPEFNRFGVSFSYAC
ncbi:mitochondrial distribution and morphology protein 10 [Scheffersomyces xylosifermentans]|uniref:mitochondrial distribution and morphology protein 10 n=1 Tax=Scheffersomyces xylosifermentans TaxID=1304137 RepID=UPI00315D26FD